MKITRLLALATTAAAFAAAAPAASAAPNSVVFNLPKCSKTSTVTVSITARANAASLVVALGAFLNGPPGIGSLLDQKIYVLPAATGATLPLGVDRTLSFKVPVGKKIYAVAEFQATGVSQSKTAISNGVKKCPKPKPKFTG